MGWQCQAYWLVGPPLWSRLKYLRNYCMDCPDTHGSQRVNPIDISDPLTHALEADICGLEWNVLTTIGWIATKIATDIHVPLMINNISDPLTFHLASPSIASIFQFDQYLQNEWHSHHPQLYFRRRLAQCRDLTWLERWHFTSWALPRWISRDYI